MFESRRSRFFFALFAGSVGDLKRSRSPKFGPVWWILGRVGKV